VSDVGDINILRLALGGTRAPLPAARGELYGGTGGIWQDDAWHGGSCSNGEARYPSRPASVYPRSCNCKIFLGCFKKLSVGADIYIVGARIVVCTAW
jgi:hypothetical protein